MFLIRPVKHKTLIFLLLPWLLPALPSLLLALRLNIQRPVPRLDVIVACLKDCTEIVLYLGLDQLNVRLLKELLQSVVPRQVFVAVTAHFALVLEVQTLLPLQGVVFLDVVLVPGYLYLQASCTRIHLLGVCLLGEVGLFLLLAGQDGLEQFVELIEALGLLLAFLFPGVVEDCLASQFDALYVSVEILLKMAPSSILAKLLSSSMMRCRATEDASSG